MQVLEEKITMNINDRVKQKPSPYRVPQKKRGSSNFHDYAIIIAKTSNLFTGTTPNITLAVNIDVNISFKIVYMKKNCKISR